jgi:aryl-phospho-beta-D-glucosidase BglC (GH1 family)
MDIPKKEMWEINIENAAASAATHYGTTVVESVFQRYDSHSFNDLRSCYYSEVFADLEQISND